MENEHSTYPAWIYKPVLLYATIKGMFRAFGVAIQETREAWKR